MMLPLEVGGPLASIRNFLSNLEAIKIIQDAIKDFDEAIKLDPMFSWSFLYRGFAFVKLDKTEQALEDFKRAASLGNKEAQGYLIKKKIPW